MYGATTTLASAYHCLNPFRTRFATSANRPRNVSRSSCLLFLPWHVSEHSTPHCRPCPCNVPIQLPPRPLPLFLEPSTRSHHEPSGAFSACRTPRSSMQSPTPSSTPPQRNLVSCNWSSCTDRCSIFPLKGRTLLSGCGAV